MIKQLLVTLAVVAIVIIFARMKRARSGSPALSQAPLERAAHKPGPSTSMLVGYALAAIMILTTAGISWMRYQEANEIVRVEVVDARSGERTIYQVRRKELGERDFKTVDGLVVSLGASDRMVRIE